MRMICFFEKFKIAFLYILTFLLFPLLAKGGIIEYKTFQSSINNYSDPWSSPQYIKCIDSINNQNKIDYRLISAHVFGSDMIFLEQLVKTDKEVKVKQAFGFSELDNDHAEYRIQDIACAVQDNKVKIFGFVSGSGHDEVFTNQDKVDKVNNFNFEILVDIKTSKYEYKTILPEHPDNTVRVKWLESKRDEKTLERQLKLPNGLVIKIDKNKGGCEDPSKPKNWMINKYLSEKQILDLLTKTHLVYYSYELKAHHAYLEGCYTHGMIFYKNKKYIQFRINPVGTSYLILYYKNPVEAHYGVSDF